MAPYLFDIRVILRIMESVNPAVLVDNGRISYVSNVKYGCKFTKKRGIMSTFANKYLRERAAPQQLKRASLHSVCTVSSLTNTSPTNPTCKRLAPQCLTEFNKLSA